MVVPTYLGAMQLGGMLGYTPLVMSNMGPALAINGLPDPSSLSTSMSYPAPPQLSTAAAQYSTASQLSAAAVQYSTASQLPTSAAQYSTASQLSAAVAAAQASSCRSSPQVSSTGSPSTLPATSSSLGCDLQQLPTLHSPPFKELASTSPASPCGSVGNSIMEEFNTQYLKELQTEKETLEASADTSLKGHALKLLENEILHIQSGGSRSTGHREPIKYFDIYRERPIRLTVRALVPVREHPKFNFVGKLLGPKGNSMKRLQEETMTKMAVLGRGSMRDKQKEEELRLSQEPKYQHLHEDLHVEITAFAPPAEAHARIAYALTEVRKYLIPDSNDEIRQEQMREMEMISGDVIDSLKQTSLVLNGLRSFPSGQQGGLSPALLTGLPVGSGNGFLAAPFLAAGGQPTTLAATAHHPTPTSLPEQYPVHGDSWTSLKAASAMDSGKHRQQPYTKPL